MKIALIGLLAACGNAPPALPPASTPVTRPLELTWVVHPVKQTFIDDRDWPLLPLDLEIGNEVITLKPQMGVLNATYQSVCHPGDSHHGYPLAADDVAKITFDEAGGGGYLVKRTGGKLVLFEWSQSHGVCVDAANQMVECKVDLERVRALDAPASSTVIQRLLVVDAAGQRTPIDCSKEFASQPDP